MLFLVALLICSALLPAEFLLSFATKVAHHSHLICLRALPESSAHAGALASLLCGERVEEARTIELLQRSALLHLFVVSGAHLIWLDQALQTLRCPSWLRACLLFLFSLACGWQAPVVRALVGAALEPVENSIAPLGRSDQRVLWAGLLTLVLFPRWVSSFSLLLSWTAALALSLPSQTLSYFDKRRLSPWAIMFRQQVVMWLLMAPLLCGWSHPTPVGFLCNLLIAPLFSFLLLPAALLACVFPITAPLFDALFEVFLAALAQLPPALPATLEMPTLPASWIWPLGVHVVLHFWFLHQKRAHA